MSTFKLSPKEHSGFVVMDKKRLEYYKKKLQARREELLKSIARTEEEGRAADDDPTVDLADKAANSYTKEFLFGQNNTDRSMLQLIDDALGRIKKTHFGDCGHCETELQQKRLEAVPWARHCTVARKNTNRDALSLISASESSAARGSPGSLLPFAASARGLP